MAEKKAKVTAQETQPLTRGDLDGLAALAEGQAVAHDLAPEGVQERADDWRSIAQDLRRMRGSDE